MIINDTRPETFMYGARQESVDTAFLQTHSSQYLTDLIQQKTPAYVRGYGNGMLSAISFRGTGAERTNVLWNGFSVNYASLGTADYSVYPVGGFNSVRIQHGSSSANYGNSSLGGSIILSYVPSWKKSFSLSAGQEYGSFNTWLTDFRATYGTRHFQGNTFFQRGSASNNFAYADLTSAGFPVRETENAAYEQYTLIQDLFFRFGRVDVDVHGWWSHMQRQIPPAMGTANAHARELDHSIRVSAGVSMKWKWGKTRLSAAWFRDEINYTDDGLTDSSLVHTYQVQLEQDLLFAKKWVFKIGGQFQYFTADQVFYEQWREEPRGAAFLLVNYTPLPQLRFSYNVRQQWVKGFHPPLTGRVGMEWDFLRKKTEKKEHKITWLVSISNGYRVPTLNDRFWVPGGSDTLRPEFSWNFETGLRYDLTGTRSVHSWEANGYYGWATDWIQWQPTPMGYWAPKNIGTVTLAGMEASYRWNWKKKSWLVKAEVLYALTFALDATGGPNDGNQLIYVPLNTVNFNAEAWFKGFYLQISNRFTDVRYVRTDLTKSIDPYFLMNIAAGKDFHFSFMDLSFSFKINNATYSGFQTIENRPMPGLSYLAGIRLGFGSSHCTKQPNNTIK